MAMYVCRKRKVEDSVDSDIVLLPSRMIKVRILIDFNFYLERFTMTRTHGGVLCSVQENGLRSAGLIYLFQILFKFIFLMWTDMTHTDLIKMCWKIKISLSYSHTHNKHTTRQKPCQDCLNYWYQTLLQRNHCLQHRCLLTWQLPWI